MRQQFHLNTKGCCFICLTSVDGGHQRSLGNKTFSLHSLSRHLGLNLMKVFSSRVKGNANLPPLGKSNVRVQLCDRCGGAAATFSELFQQLEYIRMEMEHCLERIQRLFRETDKDTKVVGQFHQVMASDIQSLLYLGIVDELRREVAAKCSVATSRAFPRVRIRRFGKGIKTLKRSLRDPEPGAVPGTKLRKLLTASLGFEACSPSPAIPVLGAGEPHPPQLPASPCPEPTKEPEESIATPLQCNFCGMDFNSSGAVTSHFNKVHLPAVKAAAAAQAASYLFLEVGHQPQPLDPDLSASMGMEPLETPIHDPLAPDQLNVTAQETAVSGSSAAFCNEGERIFKCESCGMGFMFQSNLQAHLEVAHANKLPLGFKKRKGPTLPPGIPRCSYCNKQFSSEEEVVKHVAKDHLGSVGSFTSPLETSSSNPISPFHNEGDDDDPEMDMDMINPTADHSDLGWTPMEADPLSDLNVPAPQAPVSDNLTFNIPNNLSASANPNPFQCKFCHAPFAHSPSVTRHMKNHCPILHPSTGTGSIRVPRLTPSVPRRRSFEIECDICHQQFPSHQAKLHHQSEEHKGKKFGCEICRETFWSRPAKDLHKKARCPGRVKVEAPVYLGK